MEGPSHGEEKTQGTVYLSIVLFHSTLVLVRSAVLVVSSSGYEIRMPPAVILTQFGSDFWGL